MGQGVLSAGFARSAGVLRCEGVPLDVIAEAAGTPSYVYSASTVRNRYELLAETLAPVPHRIHYTLKANSNRGDSSARARARRRSRRRLRRRAVSRARRRASRGTEIIFGGVGKTERELAEALDARRAAHQRRDRRRSCISSTSSRRSGACARRVSIRVNPEITRRRRRISTSAPASSGHKFGIPFDDARRVARARRVASARHAARSRHAPRLAAVARRPVPRGHRTPNEHRRRLARAWHRVARNTSTSAAASAFATTPRSRPISRASRSQCCRWWPRVGCS